MLVSLKALPWLLPFVRELFKRGKRRPTPSRRDGNRRSSVFLITGFFIVIGIITLFAGEKIISLMMENSGLRQENVTLHFARDANQELITQLQASNELRGRQIDVVFEQNQFLREEVKVMFSQIEAIEHNASEIRRSLDSIKHDHLECRLDNPAVHPSSKNQKEKHR